MNLLQAQDTIAAIITPPGQGAIAVVRLSGNDSISIVDKFFFTKKSLQKAAPNSIHFGTVKNEKNEVVDEVLVAVFRAPRSYTGEDVVEISCHGSLYVVQAVLQICLAHGARQAAPGEFTQRAFLNGKMDLAQAEAVADLIKAESETAQRAALHQLRGGFSDELNALRESLLHFVALMELELDFAEEDVAFADRSQLKAFIGQMDEKVKALIASFSLGNAVKNGVRVAIIGKPNAGKSTLLNALLNEERAIVSEIAGTTRDTIEETLNINGLLFRLIDTAGIREHTTDTIEHMGIGRSKKNAAEADIIIHLLDATDAVSDDQNWLEQFGEKTINVWNKSDASTPVIADDAELCISAKTGVGIDALKDVLYEKATAGRAMDGSIVTNARHYDALLKMRESLQAVQEGLSQGLSGDLLAVDVRRTLHYLGEITGQVEVDRDILGTIFGRFCIGK